MMKMALVKILAVLAATAAHPAADALQLGTERSGSEGLEIEQHETRTGTRDGSRSDGEGTTFLNPEAVGVPAVRNRWLEELLCFGWTVLFITAILSPPPWNVILRVTILIGLFSKYMNMLPQYTFFLMLVAAIIIKSMYVRANYEARHLRGTRE